MRILRYPLFAFGLCFLASIGWAQTLEHLHLAYASHEPSGLFASPSGVVRAHGGQPYRWDTTTREWRGLTDPYISDSVWLYRSLISPSGIIYDYIDSAETSGWLTRSTDGGRSFFLLPVKGRAGETGGEIAVSPTGELILSGVGFARRSTDDGQTWESIYSPVGFRNGQFDKAGNYIVLQAATPAPWTVYQLSAGDTAFDSIGMCPIPFSQNTLLATSPAPHLLLIAASSNDEDSMYLFSETLSRWEALPLPLGSADHVTTLCCDSSFNIYAGTYLGKVLRSNDTGHTWQLVSPGTAGLVWIAFQAPSTLWLATPSHVMKYDVLSRTFTGCDAPFEELDTWSLAARGDTVYALAEDDSGIFHSLDNGDTWQQFSPDSSLWSHGAGFGSQVQFSPTGATYMAGVGYNGSNVFRSYEGQKWDSITRSFEERWDEAITIDSAGSLFYRDNYNSDISTDDGNTWNRLALPNLYFAGVTYYGFLCWAQDSLFHYTPDEGQTWNYAYVNDTLARGNAFIHSAAGRIWLAYDSVLELSTDAGSTWSRAMNGLTRSPLRAITTDPYGHTYCIQGYLAPGYGSPITCSIYGWNPLSQRWNQLTPDTALSVYSLCANSKYLFLGTQAGVFRVAITDFPLGISPPLQSEAAIAIAYPDPATRTFSVRFFLHEPSPVELTLYDILGNSVGHVNAGVCGAGWDSIPVKQNLSTGTYVCEVRAGRDILRGHVAIASR